MSVISTTIKVFPRESPFQLFQSSFESEIKGYIRSSQNNTPGRVFPKSNYKHALRITIFKLRIRINDWNSEKQFRIF